MKDYIGVFSHQTEILIDILSKEKEGSMVCINELMNKVTLNIIGTSGFGFNFSAFDDDQNTIGFKTYKAFSGLIHAHDVITAFVPIAKVSKILKVFWLVKLTNHELVSSTAKKY